MISQVFSALTFAAFLAMAMGLFDDAAHAADNIL